MIITCGQPSDTSQRFLTCFSLVNKYLKLAKCNAFYFCSLMSFMLMLVWANPINFFLYICYLVPITQVFVTTSWLYDALCII